MARSPRRKSATRLTLRRSGAARKKQSRAPTTGGGAPLPPPARVLVMVVAFAVMVAFGAVLARLTLQPSAASEALTHTNLRPGDSLRDYLTQPAFVDTVKQLGGNIVLGVPFGLLLPVVAPKTRGPLRVVLVTAAVMLLVELVQGALVTGRAFDIDDVILNTTGALLGYVLLGRRLGRAVHPRRRHWWQRRTSAA
ncbi:VanZ family protein [Streptomyces niger]|uniref:VanZ family protein n=1 Tax=Streptomyces niger TaxID=66373 RepID=UPI001F2FFE23|nr:VanZ family protein [Streptomyces niger]